MINEYFLKTNDMSFSNFQNYQFDDYELAKIMCQENESNKPLYEHETAMQIVDA